MTGKIISKNKRKCSLCKNKSLSIANGKPLCLTHYVKNCYGKNKGCLEASLDELIDRKSGGRRLSSGEKAFLQEVRKQFPGIAEEFPVLFGAI